MSKLGNIIMHYKKNLYHNCCELSMFNNVIPKKVKI